MALGHFFLIFLLNFQPLLDYLTQFYCHLFAGISVTTGSNYTWAMTNKALVIF